MDPTIPPVVDPEVPNPKPEEPLCNFPGRGEGPDECPPGQGGDPPGDVIKDPPGEVKDPGNGDTPPGPRGLLARLLDRLLP